ncbi:transmembrane protein 26-like isoform X2 [Tubulanus polymorphus]|uniref:transmembrane protein 26-like isoform X2 n=1 Tax=Tubulanus polymorphus TaxID=672921 RepID=UPI003DA3720C
MNLKFCLCVLFFLIPNVTCIWLLQTKYNRCILNYNSTGRFKEDCEGEDIEITFEKIFGVRVAIPQLSHLRWIMSIQQAMIILLVIGRCLLPNKLVDRFRLARLLLVLIANGADVIEFYQTQSDMKIEKVRDTEIYVLLAFWTWSLVPFCFYLTATEDRDDETPEVEQKATTEQTDGNQTKNSKYINILIDERWSLLFQCLCMDGPYLAMRLYIMSTYKLFTSSILFFVAKNAILLIVDLYLFFLLCCSDERKAARKAKQRAIELKKSNTSVLPVLIQKA